LTHLPNMLSDGNKTRTLGETPPEIREQVRKVVMGDAPWPLVMLGAVGAGKTCTALCMLDRVAKSRRYYTAQQFVDDARDADMGRLMRGDYLESIREFWKNWRNYGITCVDEIGSRSSREKVSDHHYEAIKRSIDERHGKPCIWISNLTLQQISQVYDDRIASRLSEGTHITFTGADRRLKKGTT